MLRVIVPLILFIIITPAIASDIRIYAENAPPNAYLEEGEIKGYAVKVVRSVLVEAGEADLPIKLVPWARGYTMLSSEKGAALFPVTRTEEFEDKFEWAGEIMTDTVHLYRLKSRSDIRIHSLRDLRKYKLGLSRFDATDQILSRITENIEYVTNDKQNFLKALNHRIDIFPYASHRFNYELSKEGLNTDLFEQVYLLSKVSMPQYLAFNKQTDSAVVERFKEAFMRLAHKESMTRVSKK